ncbi:11755_t:CDS:2, partial [Acaulospora morrowiae]
MKTASTALNILYYQLYNEKTEYFGPAIMEFNQSDIVQKLSKEIEFISYFIKVNLFLIVISSIGTTSNSGFTSSLLIKFENDRCLVVQKVLEDKALLEFYIGNKLKAHFENESPITVWKQTGILKNYNESEIEFWSKSNNPKTDIANIKQLYMDGLLDLGQKQPILIDIGNEETFWNSFRTAWSRRTTCRRPHASSIRTYGTQQH